MVEVKVSIGVNRKVGSDTAIINMGPATDCPAARLGLCQVGGQKKCYAMKAERMYPNVLKYRRKQAKIWKQVSAKEIADKILELTKKEHRDNYDKIKRKLKYLRFSEAGDFESQADVDKMSEIAELLKGKLVVYGYTARKDLDFSKTSDNMIINGSNFMVDNMFKVVAKIPEDAKFVCNGNCRKCNLCKFGGKKTIYVKIH